MYHFAFDGNEANVAERVGSNVYAYELMHTMEQLTRDNDEFQWTVLLSSSPVYDLPAPRAGWEYKVISPRAMWTQIGLPIHLFLHKNEYQAFFTPGHYAPRVSAVPYISSVMDLGFLKFPEQFRKKDYLQLKEWTRYSVKHAAKVLTISEFTKSEVVKTYKRKEKDVFVAYPALPEGPIDEEKVPSQWVKKRIGTDEPYLLYVGTLQPRKNLLAVLRAFEVFSEHYPRKTETPQFVVAGKIGWLADEFLSAVEKSPLKERIHLLGYVSDAEKKALYRKSTAHVLLGLYEGFGIPPLEAMAEGTIPIVSNSSSLPEVVAHAGHQVSPLNIEEIAHAMTEVFTLKAKQRAAILKKGREQFKKFSWVDSGQKIIEMLVEIADGAQK